jgi:hypothetical protein
MKSPLQVDNHPVAELNNLLTKWRQFMMRMARPHNLRLVLVTIFVLGFVLGVFSTFLPKTLFTQPVQTVRLMRSFPLGSTVMPKDTPQAREQFQPFGWREPAVVVGYDTVTYKRQVIMLCRVRIHENEGDVLTVNPSWLEHATEIKKSSQPD